MNTGLLGATLSNISHKSSCVTVIGKFIYYFLSVSDSIVTALLFVILFLFVDMAHSGTGAVLGAMLTVAFVFCLTAFGAFAIT